MGSASERAVHSFLRWRTKVPCETNATGSVEFKGILIGFPECWRSVDAPRVDVATLAGWTHLPGRMFMDETAPDAAIGVWLSVYGGDLDIRQHELEPQCREGFQCRRQNGWEIEIGSEGGDGGNRAITPYAELRGRNCVLYVGSYMPRFLSGSEADAVLRRSFEQVLDATAEMNDGNLVVQADTS